MVNLCRVKLDCSLGWQFLVEAKAIQFRFDLIRFKFNEKNSMWTHVYVTVYENILCECVCHNCHTLSKSLMTVVPNSLSYNTVCFNEFSMFAGRNTTFPFGIVHGYENVLCLAKKHILQCIWWWWWWWCTTMYACT